MKTKFHVASEPIKKLKAIQVNLDSFFHPMSTTHRAILAGGALRDDFMGLNDDINDYDIFISDLAGGGDFSPSSMEDKVTALISSVFNKNTCSVEQLFDSDYLTPQEQYDSKYDVKPGSNEQIQSVWEVDDGRLTYQLIFTKADPIVHVEKYFDFGLCKAWCDGRKIRYTDDFLYDVKHKTLTLVGDDLTSDQIQYAIDHHAAKLLWKYPTFRVVVPPRYQKHVVDCGFPTS